MGLQDFTVERRAAELPFQRFGVELEEIIVQKRTGYSKACCVQPRLRMARQL